MLKNSLLLKILGLIVLGLGAVTVMAYYSGVDPVNWVTKFPGTIYDYFLKKPKAPEITLVKNEGSCGARVFWYDNEPNEDGVRLYRSVNGGNFEIIRVTLPHAGGPGSFDDGNLPMGTYVYKVSVFNENGESFSDPSDPVVIDEAVCGNEPLLPKPLNPLITGIELVKNADCTIRLYYQDNSSNEDGIRIHRWSWVDNPAIIAELPASNQPNGSYDDVNLPDGHYTYQISVFNANGESYSNVSDEVEIIQAKCDTGGFDPSINPIAVKTLTPSPTPVTTSTLTLVPTATFTPVPESQACIWTALINTFIRTGPGASLYPEITAVTPGTSLPVIGQSEDGFFWALDVDKLIGYVAKAERFGAVNGDCSNIPTLIDPTPSAPTAAPLPQCSDGIDNDRDGAIDMRDRGCTSPSDNSER